MTLADDDLDVLLAAVFADDFPGVISAAGPGDGVVADLVVVTFGDEYQVMLGVALSVVAVAAAHVGAATEHPEAQPAEQQSRLASRAGLHLDQLQSSRTKVERAVVWERRYVVVDVVEVYCP